jgi:hypothetical protein
MAMFMQDVVLPSDALALVNTTRLQPSPASINMRLVREALYASLTEKGVLLDRIEEGECRAVVFLDADLLFNADTCLLRRILQVDRGYYADDGDRKDLGQVILRLYAGLLWALKN